MKALGHGLQHWFLQRLTAVVLLTYTVFLLGLAIFKPESLSWFMLWQQNWMKVISFIALLSLCYHAWIGMIDIYIDYIHSFIFRCILKIFSALWLGASIVYGAKIFWNI